MPQKRFASYPETDWPMHLLIGDLAPIWPFPAATNRDSGGLMHHSRSGLRSSLHYNPPQSFRRALWQRTFNLEAKNQGFDSTGCAEHNFSI